MRHQTLSDQIRKVQPSDFEEIKSWFDSRKIGIPGSWVLSNLGFMVPGVAAGFIYIHGKIGMFDCYISNPDAKLKSRSEALDLITKLLIHEATFVEELEMLVCNTKHESIKRLAMRHGFKDDGLHMSLSKRL